MKTEFKIRIILSVFIVFSLCFIPGVSNAQLGKLSKVKSPLNKKEETKSGASDDAGTSGSVVADNSANTEEAIRSFTENKDDIDSCRKYLKEFINEEQYSNVLIMAGNINKIINQGDEIINDINANIPDIAAFENENEDAKTYHLKSQLGWLESDLKRAKTRFSDIKPSLLSEIEREVYKSKMSEVSLQHTAMIMDDVNNYFAMLDEFFPDDADIEKSRSVNIPAIQAEYDKKMKNIGSNRMALSKYGGADKTALEKKLAAAYNTRYADAIVKKVSITDPSWSEKRELIDDNTKAYWRTSDYIGAHVAVEKDNVCKVYIVTFRKDRSSGEIELNSVGANYPVLIENISK